MYSHCEPIVINMFTVKIVSLVIVINCAVGEEPVVISDGGGETKSPQPVDVSHEQADQQHLRERFLNVLKVYCREEDFDDQTLNAVYDCLTIRRELVSSVDDVVAIIVTATCIRIQSYWPLARTKRSAMRLRPISGASLIASSIRTQRRRSSRKW